MQVSMHFRHSLGVWAEVSEKSATQPTQAKGLIFISRSLVQWQGDGVSLQNKAVLVSEKLCCRNRYRACCQSEVNLSLNSALAGLLQPASCTQVDVMFSLTGGKIWTPGPPMRHSECSTIMPHWVASVTLGLEKKKKQAQFFLLS